VKAAQRQLTDGAILFCAHKRLKSRTPLIPLHCCRWCPFLQQLIYSRAGHVRQTCARSWIIQKVGGVKAELPVVLRARLSPLLSCAAQATCQRAKKTSIGRRRLAAHRFTHEYRA